MDLRTIKIKQNDLRNTKQLSTKIHRIIGNW